MNSHTDAVQISNELENLIAQKTFLVSQLQQAREAVVRVNEKIAVRLPDSVFKTLSRERAGFVQVVSKTEARLSSLNARIKELRQCKDGPVITVTERSYLVDRLREIRDKYSDVSAGEFDVHGPSERLLAAQVVRDLNPILKRLVNE